MKKIKSSVLSFCALGVLSTACLKIDNPIAKERSTKRATNLVTNKESKVNALIGDEKHSLQIISEAEFRAQNLSGAILSVRSPEALKILNDLPQTSEEVQNKTERSELKSEEEESLLLGIPLGLLGEESMFGGVITKVSDKTNESLGTLKLTDLSPLHVRTMITMAGGAPAVTLVGCASACEEGSQQSALISFPVVGVDQEKGTVIVDLAPIGKELDLISMMDPTGSYTKLKAISSATTAFDYSYSTLVFDIKTKMIPVDADPTAQNNPITEFTVRWYLKLTSGSNSAFASRTPTEGVGFFTTERSKSPKITRFSTTNFGKNVKYYVKNVPNEWKPVFAKAFDNWNVEFKKIIGRDLLSYEFVDATDPRSEILVAGDIRFNVMEWDLHNIASYGGLGPSIANQFTGETLSANVLIQGPTIISLYSKWFKLSEEVRNLQQQGRSREANAITAKFNKEAAAEIAKRSKAKFSVKIGDLEMNVHAQRTDLEDPMIKNHFEVVPEGVTFEQYMTGYFTEMLEHELGHNLGLRHNFKGNLGATETGEQGSVSRSIMEYLGRPYRHMSAIGLYDKMAIAYGYRGVAPKHLNWFCTDEDQGSDKLSLAMKSAECTKSDATSDPFSFFEGRLARAIHLLVDTKSAHAPVWKMSEVTSQVDEALTGLSAYALSAEKTMHTWTNFFGKVDRPETAPEIKEYVLKSLKKKICNPELASIILAKESVEAQKLAQANLDALRAHVEKKTADFGLYSAEQLKCN